MAIYYTSSGLTTGQRIGIIVGISILVLLISLASYSVRKRQADRIRAEADRLAALQANQIRMDQLPPYTNAPGPGYAPYGTPPYGTPMYPQQPFSTLPPSMAPDNTAQYKNFAPPQQGMALAAVPVQDNMNTGAVPPTFPQPEVGAQAPAVPGPPQAGPTGVPPAYQEGAK